MELNTIPGFGKLPINVWAFGMNMKKYYFGFLLFIIFACKTTMNIEETAMNTSDPEYLLFKVIEFERDALHFDYEEGTGEWFSGSKIKLMNYNLNEQEFWIYHENELNENSEWRNINSIVKCKYSKKVLISLTNDTHFFSSQLEIVKE